jgi:hypothetical protein
MPLSGRRWRGGERGGHNPREDDRSAHGENYKRSATFKSAFAPPELSRNVREKFRCHAAAAAAY